MCVCTYGSLIETMYTWIMYHTHTTKRTFTCRAYKLTISISCSIVDSRCTQLSFSSRSSATSFSQSLVKALLRCSPFHNSSSFRSTLPSCWTLPLSFEARTQSSRMEMETSNLVYAEYSYPQQVLTRSVSSNIFCFTYDPSSGVVSAKNMHHHLPLRQPFFQSNNQSRSIVHEYDYSYTRPMMSLMCASPKAASSFLIPSSWA